MGNLVLKNICSPNRAKRSRQTIRNNPTETFVRYLKIIPTNHHISLYLILLAGFAGTVPYSSASVVNNNKQFNDKDECFFKINESTSIGIKPNTSKQIPGKCQECECTKDGDLLSYSCMGLIFYLDTVAKKFLLERHWNFDFRWYSFLLSFFSYANNTRLVIFRM
ncbi:uncharacterized protein LOC135924685 isoform X1 [Gordionus sp. m RMFG-2023]|uniref:uncharacterized protein LOC135924685 isoform X1 n=1 Tax=Gordionus sp. m RMFG-2023 TaxID=3053472 RepID=UPI0031FBBAA9